MKTKRILLTLIAALLALTLCFSLVGCGNDKKDKDDDKDETKATQSEPAPDPEPDPDPVPNPVGNEAEDVADDFMTASYIDFDAAALTALFHPGTLDALCAVDNMTISDFESVMDQLLQGLSEQYADAEIEWEITDCEDVDDLTDIQTLYDNYGGAKVSAAQTVTVEASATTSEGVSSPTVEISVVEIDGDWYMDLSMFY